MEQRSRRIVRNIAAVAAIAAAATACSELLVSPATTPSGLVVSYSLAEPPAGMGSMGGVASAFDKADRLRVLLVNRTAGTSLDTVLQFTPAPTVSVPLRLDIGAEQEQVELTMELRRGTAALFRGSANIAVRRADTTAVDVQLAPVPADVLLPSNLAPLTAYGDTVRLDAAVVFATGDTIPGLPVAWVSLNPEIASVNQAGHVVALSEGQAQIRATHAGLLGLATVTVAPTVHTVTLQAPTQNLLVDQTVTVTATARDRRGNLLLRTFTWGTVNTAIATATSTGPQTASVRGVSGGQTQVTATAGGVSGSLGITVTAVPVASVTVTPQVDTLRTGQTRQLTATLRDAAGNTLNRPVSWATSSGSIASVSGTGLVTATGPGTATITATSEGRSGNATIVVLDAVASVTATPPTASIAVGGFVDVTATARNSAGTPLTGRQFTWQTSDATIASVTPIGSSTARITANAIGQATITVTSEGVSTQIPVTTQTGVASVQVFPPSGQVAVGQNLGVVAIARDGQGNIIPRVVTWETSNPAIATVSSTGDSTALVIGVASGQALITATTEGVSGSTTVFVVGSPGVYFEDSFEGPFAWAATGMWNRTTGAGITNSAWPTFVNLPSGENAPALPAAFQGQWYAWYGDPATGNYMGAQDADDWEASGGTSVTANAGSLLSPAFTVPAGVNGAFINFAAWWEIESVYPDEFDTMDVVLVDANTQVPVATLRLNPFSEGDPEEDAATPFTSGGYNQPPVWQTYSQFISGIGGRSLRIRLEFATEDEMYNGFRGWIMDAISVTSQSAFSGPAGAGGAGTGAGTGVGTAANRGLTVCQGACPRPQPRRR